MFLLLENKQKVFPSPSGNFHTFMVIFILTEIINCLGYFCIPIDFLSTLLLYLFSCFSVKLIASKKKWTPPTGE